MSTTRENVALEWTRDELIETLAGARHALESYAESVAGGNRDPGMLLPCSEALHTARGALYMLELRAAASFAADLEDLTRGLAAGSLADPDDAAQALMQGLLELPDYLEAQRVGLGDTVGPLLAVLNEVRAHLGQPALPVEMLVPSFEAAPDEDVLSRFAALDGLDKIRRLRGVYQQVLLTILKGTGGSSVTGTLQKIGASLRQLCVGTPQAILWEALEEYVKAIGSEPEQARGALDADAVRLLRRLDSELRAIAQEGLGALSRPVPAELLRDLVDAAFYAGRSSRFLLTQRQALAAHEFSGSLASSARNALAIAAVALRDELATIRDQVDLMARGAVTGSAQEELREGLAVSLRQIGSAMSLLGLESSRAIILAELERLDEATSLGDAAAESMGHALLQVDLNLAAFTRNGRPEARQILDAAQQAVLAQVRRDLETLKQAIVDYVTGQWDRRFLESLPEGIATLGSALRILPLADAADLLDRCLAYVLHDLRGGRIPDWAELDQFAGALSALDFYLERLSSPNRAGAREILDYARQSLASLEGWADGSSGVRSAPQPILTAAVADTLESPTAEDEIAEPETLADELIEESAAASVADVEPAALVIAVADQPDIADAMAVSAVVGNPESLELERLMQLGDNFDCDDEILEVFVEEVEEVLAEAGTKLSSWRANLGDIELAVELRRAFHTLKGSGRLVGARVLGELGWAVEQLLNRVLDGSLAPSDSIADVIDAALKLIPELKSAFADRESRALADVAGLIVRAGLVATGMPIVAVAHSPVDLEPAEPASEPASDVIELELGEPSVEPVLAAAEGAEAELVELDLDELDELSIELEAPAPADAEPVEPGLPASEYVEPDLIELDLDELDEPSVELEVPVAARSEPAGPAAVIEAPSVEQPDFLDSGLVFREEAAEYIAQLVQARDGSAFLVDETFSRALHTLAGSASTVGRSAVADLARATLDLVHALLGSRASVRIEGPNAEFLDEVVTRLAVDLEFSERSQRDAFDVLLAEAGRLREEAPIAPIVGAITGLRHLETLLGAQQFLDDWRFGGYDAEAARDMQAAIEELAALAQEVDPPAFGELVRALLDAYVRLGASDELNDPVAGTLWAAHERLLGQIDALVAGLPLPTADAEVADLNALEGLHPVALATAAEPLSGADLVPQPTSEESSLPVAAPAELLPAEASANIVAPLEPVVAEVDPELVAIFLEEAEELLEQIDEDLQACRSGRDARAPVERLLRALHTFKGGARLAGLPLTGEAAHVFESRVIALADKGGEFGPAALEELQDRHDDLAARIGAVAGGAQEPSVSGLRPVATVTQAGDRAAQPVEQVIAAGKGPADRAPTQADAMPATNTPPVPRVESAETAAVTEPQIGQIATIAAPVARAVPASRQLPADETGGERRSGDDVVRVRAALLEELVNLAGEGSIIRARVEQGLSQFGTALDEMETTIQRLREQLRRLEIETEAQILFRHERADGPGYEDFDPLELDRYSQLQQLSRGLSESASDMLDLKETLRSRIVETEGLLVQQGRVNTQLQEGLMRSRMVPFLRLLPRLRRTVRQAAQELGKSVELMAYDVEGELDRSLLDQLVAPLEHMLRNAVDHGIESAEARQAAGKPATGQIEMRLAREGGDVVIEIRDDGAGIDVSRVRAKALERGLMTPEADLSDDEVRQFIFAPGFSTARSVTQISGRGVGMDVAFNTVRRLGGNLTADSEPGRGTRFRVRVPFSVSVNRALMVTVGQDLYALPLNTIEGIVLARSDEFRDSAGDDERTFEYVGIRYVVHSLADYLGLQRAPVVDGDSVPLVLVRSGERATAVQVDAVQGSREIVVKGLGPQFAGVAGISGATILGDGGVVVILDLPALVRAGRYRPAPERQRSSATRGPWSVLVVDDSVTVRKVTSRLLARQGMEVRAAKDGVEALAMLQERRPDMILLDIEMPRMDGFELLRHIRHDPALAELPVIMISSRTGAKHQDRAAELGVSHFLGKPFQEAQLLETIERFRN